MMFELAAFVVWMQRSGQLPAETPVVLSQVAFRVLIPCFLMTKVHHHLFFRFEHPTSQSAPCQINLLEHDKRNICLLVIVNSKQENVRMNINLAKECHNAYGRWL